MLLLHENLDAHPTESTSHKGKLIRKITEHMKHGLESQWRFQPKSTGSTDHSRKEPGWWLQSLQEIHCSTFDETRQNLTSTTGFDRRKLRSPPRSLHLRHLFTETRPASDPLALEAATSIPKAESKSLRPQGMSAEKRWCKFGQSRPKVSHVLVQLSLATLNEF